MRPGFRCRPVTAMSGLRDPSTRVTRPSCCERSPYARDRPRRAGLADGVPGREAPRFVGPYASSMLLLIEILLLIDGGLSGVPRPRGHSNIGGYRRCQPLRKVCVERQAR